MTLQSELERIMEQVRQLRDSDLNPCAGEDVHGVCPCHSFDNLLDSMQKMKEIK